MAKQALWPDVTMETIVRRARILVIDDGDFPYRDLFKKAGFSIEKWSEVQRLQDLEAGLYDLILLDLHGIGRKLSNDQGLGVLQHLKANNPDQVVVAYSNAEWGVKYQPFFDMADAVLDKSADYLDFKRVVEDLLYRHFNVNEHAIRLQAALVEAGYRPRAATKMVKTLLASGDLDSARTSLGKKISDTATVDNLVALGGVVVKIAELWKS